MDELKNNQQPREETAAEKANRYMTDEERREWSGLSEWQDPLEKERPAEETSGKFAMASLLFGIAAMMTSCVGILSALFGAAAILFGILSKKKSETADKAATIGIVLGIIGIGIMVAVLIFRIVMENAASGVTNHLPSIPD